MGSHPCGVTGVEVSGWHLYTALEKQNLGSRLI